MLKYQKITYFIYTILFISTGFYYIPDVIINGTLIFSGSDDLNFFKYAKRIAYCVLIIIMFLKINWYKIKVDFFLIACLFWLIGHVITYFFDQTNNNLYIERFFQLLFVFSFVTYFRQSNITQIREIFLYLPQKSISFLFLILLLLSYTSSEWAHGVFNGFGNQRVNFSIWISQFFLLVLLAPIFKNNENLGLTEINFIKILIVLTPIYTLQFVTAGRTGLLVTILIMMMFTWIYNKSFKTLSLTFAYLCLIGILININTPFAIHSNKFDDSTIEFVKTFRNITPDYFNNNNLNGLEKILPSPTQKDKEQLSEDKLFEYFDHLSSRRLLLITYSLDQVKDMNPFIGLGIQRNLLSDSDGYTGAYGRRVHNLFLNHYSEIGIFGLISLLIIYFQLIINFKGYNDRGKILVLSFFICGMVSILQPTYLFSQISISLVAWFVYSLLLGKNFKKR